MTRCTGEKCIIKKGCYRYIKPSKQKAIRAQGVEVKRPQEQAENCLVRGER